MPSGPQRTRNACSGRPPRQHAILTVGAQDFDRPLSNETQPPATHAILTRTYARVELSMTASSQGAIAVAAITTPSELSALASEVASILKQRKQTIGVAESSTGGLISAALLAIPGASAYFTGGGVIYTIAARRALLGISDEVLKGMKPLSDSYVSQCAKTIRTQLGTTWGLAELGATGPAGTRYGHPPGISVLAIDGPVTLTRNVATGSGDREANMWEFTRVAMQLLRDALAQQ